MIVKIMKPGKSFIGAGRYHLHDAPHTDADGRRVNPTTASRVRFTATRNLVNADPALAMLEMGLTAAGQGHLKAMSGRGGGITATPVKTIVLAWPPPAPGKAAPSPAEMEAAADDYLAHMGWQRHQAVLIAHADTPHPHLHIIMSRVDPDTGALADEAHERRRSQPWALAFEREEGAIRCAKRLTADYTDPGSRAAPVSYAQARLQADTAGDIAMREEDLARLDGPDRDLLPAWQRRERDAFHAGAREEGARLAARLRRQVRDEMRPQWRDHYQQSRERLARAQGIGETVFVAERAAIMAERRRIGRKASAALRERTTSAAIELQAERRQRLIALKIRQAEERAELRHLDAQERRGAPVDTLRHNYLRHGPVAPPTEPGHLLKRLRQANDSHPAAASLPAAGDDNGARPPVKVALRASIHHAPARAGPWPGADPPLPPSPLQQRITAQLAALRRHETMTIAADAAARHQAAPPAGVGSQHTERAITPKADRAMLAAFSRAMRARLTAEHHAAVAAFQATTARLMHDAELRAEAEIGAKFGHLWAMLLQQSGTPQFAAKAAALRAQQAAELAGRKRELTGLVMAERSLSRALLADLQRRERRQLRQRVAGARQLIAPNVGTNLRRDLDRNRRATRMLYAMAAAQATWQRAPTSTTLSSHGLRPH